MRRPFVPLRRRLAPVETADIDPNPSDDFHPTNAQRARRERLQQRERDAAAAEATTREHARKRGQNRTPAENTPRHTGRVTVAEVLEANARNEPRAARTPRKRLEGEYAITATFEQVKETKGAFQFAETDNRGQIITDIANAQIGSLYLRKTALDGVTPQRITVTVTFD